MDFNNVSEEVNNIIRTGVIPPFKAMAKKASIVQFYGAVELNRKHPDVEYIEVEPVSLTLNK